MNEHTGDNREASFAPLNISDADFSRLTRFVQTQYGIDLSKNTAPLLKYAERIFSRPAYIEALTPSEKVMRK